VLEDARARRLLSRHTVAIKVAAEDNPLLAARYGFEGLPTFLFLRPDGTEVDRVVGHPDVRGFLEEAADYAIGRDRVTLALESAIDAHVRLAGALVQKKKFREHADAAMEWADDLNPGGVMRPLTDEEIAAELEAEAKEADE